jgi:hypothetical protein
MLLAYEYQGVMLAGVLRRMKLPLLFDDSCGWKIAQWGMAANVKGVAA